MNTLSFTFGPADEWNDHEVQVRILIDGVDVLKRVDDSALGLDPDDFFAQPGLLASGDLLIGRCSCGSLGCDDEWVQAVHEGGVISWHSAHPCISGVSFHRPDFLSAIAQARADTRWETVERTAERRVRGLDFSAFGRKGMTFEWASGRRDKANLILCFRREGKQEFLEVKWDHRDPAEAERAVKQLIRDLEPG
jgi:hypothetical protein